MCVDLWCQLPAKSRHRRSLGYQSAAEAAAGSRPSRPSSEKAEQHVALHITLLCLKISASTLKVLSVRHSPIFTFAKILTTACASLLTELQLRPRLI